MKNEVSVRTQGVKRNFGDVHVLRGIDFEVQAGELIALYGASGSGKTTLLNLIGALDYPNAGDVEVLGRDIVSMNENARAKLRRTQIGFIFQSATLLPTYTALENIDLALRLPGLGYFERARRAKAAMRAVGLTDWADHVPEELSGGQQQRIVIARALALRAKLFLADEPSSGIDIATTRRILSLFRGIAEAEGTSFLIATHDPLIVEYVDTVYDLLDGQLVARPMAEQQKEALRRIS